MDIATATPAEIDTALSEIYTRYYSVQDDIARHTEWIQDLENGLAKFAAGDRRYSTYSQERLDDLRTNRSVLEFKAVEILDEAEPFNDEFTRRGGWSRFWLVQNNGGHIHNSMGCSTCYATTRFGWLPSVSGKTEPEAVAEFGAILCTVCFPSAPTEWTNGKKPGDEAYCEGTQVDWDKPHRKGYAYGNWGTCSTCGETAAFTNSKTQYKLRKHKKPV